MIRVFLCDDDPSYLEYLSGIVGQFFQQNKIEAGIKTFLDGETLLEEPEMAEVYQREESVCADLYCIIHGTLSG